MARARKVAVAAVEAEPMLESVMAAAEPEDEPVLDSQSRGEDPAEPDVPPIDAARAAWYELEVRKNERAEWLVSSRGTISRAEDARDMLRVPQSFDLQQAEWARADYTRAGYETKVTIKRSDFGMNFMPGGIGDDIDLTIAFEGVKK